MPECRKSACQSVDSPIAKYTLCAAGRFLKGRGEAVPSAAAPPARDRARRRALRREGRRGVVGKNRGGHIHGEPGYRPLAPGFFRGAGREAHETMREGLLGLAGASR